MRDSVSAGSESGDDFLHGALRTALLAAALLSMLPAYADYEAGQQAWDAGRVDEALAQWQTAAGSGDRRAMHALGRMYLQGFGVLQSFVEAHKWFNLAASRGDTAAAAERDALAEKMTPGKIARAQALARAWRPGETPVPATTDSHASTEADSPTPELIEETLTPTRDLTATGADSPDTTAAAPPAVELVEETSTPTRTLPSDAAPDQAAADSAGTTASPSPATVLDEETLTPTRDPTPDAGPTRRFRIGDLIQDCTHCPELVVVPAGTFRMGSPGSESGRFSGEGPVHRVTIAEPFAVGVHEVTFEEWDACVLEGGCGRYRAPDEGWGRGRRPVVNVSWDDARSYVDWLSGSTGEGYRLLSESEWEYVARAGTGSPFHFGETISTEKANYDGRYRYGAGRGGEAHTGGRRCRSARFRRTASGSTMCTGTCGSGCAIAGAGAMGGRRRTGVHARRRTVPTGWRVAAPGTTSPRTCAPPFATTTKPRSGAPWSGFGWPGCSLRRSGPGNRRPLGRGLHPRHPGRKPRPRATNRSRRPRLPIRARPRHERIGEAKSFGTAGTAPRWWWSRRART